MEPQEHEVWYRSQVLRGIAIATLTQILNRFHFTAHFAPQAAAYVDTIIDLVSFYFICSAAYARVKHPLPKVTLTQAQADRANAPGGAVPFAKPSETSP